MKWKSDARNQELFDKLNEKMTPDTQKYIKIRRGMMLATPSQISRPSSQASKNFTTTHKEVAK